MSAAVPLQTSDPSTRRDAWRVAATWLSPILGVAIVSPYCFVQIADADVGFHLALGRLIARDGIPFSNALSWTVPEFPWYPPYWLFDRILFATHSVLGVLGIQLLVLALLTFAAFATAFACARLDRFGGVLGGILPVALAQSIVGRPQMATYAVLSAVVWLGVGAREKATRWRAAGLALVVLAANLHAGAVFPAVMLALFCLEAFLATRRWQELLVAAASGLALLANPGGLAPLRYLVQQLDVFRLFGMGEFRAPNPEWDQGFFLGLALVLALTPLALRRVPAHVAAAWIFAGSTFSAIRLNSEFWIAAAPLLAWGLGQIRSRLGNAAWAPLVLVLFGGTLAEGRLLLRLEPLEFGARFWDENLPVRAAAFIREIGLTGRGYNSLHEGGYLAWALDAPVFQDARLQAYPSELFVRQREAEQDPASFDSFLAGYGTEWALTFGHPNAYTGFSMLSQLGDKWALVYWDATDELWLKRDVARLAPLIERHEYKLFKRPYGTLVQRLKAAEETSLSAFASEIDRFARTSPDHPMVPLARCVIQRRTGATSQPDPCELARARAEQEPTLKTQLDEALAP